MMKKLLQLIARRRELGRWANIAEGTHANGRITRRVDAAHSARNLLVKVGSDGEHVAVTTAGTERPLGVCDDTPAAAEDYTNVNVLGKGADTKLGVAAAAIAVGDELVAAAGGKVQPLPAGAGTYYIIGTALTAAAVVNQDVEIADHAPVQRVVAG